MKGAILMSCHPGLVEIVPMSLPEVLPNIRALSRTDKLRLIQLLAQELERDESDLIEPGQSYPVWSPDQAFSAAAALLEALEEDKRHPSRSLFEVRPKQTP